LDRRIEAYEKVNELNSLMATFVQMENYIIHAHFTAQIPLNILCNKIRNCINDSLWLSNNTGNLLTEMNTFIINEFDNNIDPSWPQERANSKVRKVALEKFDEINSFKKKLKLSVTSGIKNLHEIDEFFEEQDKSDGFPIYGRTHSHKSDHENYE